MKTNLLSFFLFSLLLAAMSVVCPAQTSDVDAGKSGLVATTNLTATQLEAIKSIRAESEKKAVPLALQVAAAAKQIYENILSEKENGALRKRLRKQMNKAVVKLLAVKGQAMRDMVKVLTPEQRRLIRDEMQKPDAQGDLSEIIQRVFNVTEK